jgi:hypothetical protein
MGFFRKTPKSAEDALRPGGRTMRDSAEQIRFVPASVVALANGLLTLTKTR